MLKIGIYGGSFDPPHIGHKKVAEYVVDKLNLDKLLIIPVGKASHGKEKLEDGNLRYKMCQINFKNIKSSEVSKIEINSDKVSYTYETLENIKNIYGEYNEYFEIIGEDSASYFNKWKNYSKILESSTVVILKRKGYKNIIKNKKIIELENDYYEISSSEIKEKIKNNDDTSNELISEVKEFIEANGLYK